MHDEPAFQDVLTRITFQFNWARFSRFRVFVLRVI
jgi:hypothetical protein